MAIPRETFRRVLTEFPAGAGKIRAELAARTHALLDGLEAARVKSFEGPRAAAQGGAMTAETLSRLASLRAPTSEDIDALAQAAFDAAPRFVSAPQRGSGHSGGRLPG